MEVLKGRASRPGMQPDLRYIRVTEHHDGGGWQQGYRHYHALVDRYMDARIVIAIWKRVTGGEGSAHVRGTKSVKELTRYVVKYVVKSAMSGKTEKGEHLHTRSHGIRLFRPKPGEPGKWIVIDLRRSSCLEGTLNISGTETRSVVVLSGDSSPPNPSGDAGLELELVLDVRSEHADSILAAIVQ